MSDSDRLMCRKEGTNYDRPHRESLAKKKHLGRPMFETTGISYGTASSLRRDREGESENRKCSKLLANFRPPTKANPEWFMYRGLFDSAGAFSRIRSFAGISRDTGLRRRKHSGPSGRQTLGTRRSVFVEYVRHSIFCVTPTTFYV